MADRALTWTSVRDGIWIHTADDVSRQRRFEGRNIVIDGVPNDSDGKTALLDYMASAGAERRDHRRLIITHRTTTITPVRSDPESLPGAGVYDPGYPLRHQVPELPTTRREETADGHPIVHAHRLVTIRSSRWEANCRSSFCTRTGVTDWSGLR